ncbi:MAG: hypothetical protein SGBAC_012268 [Bacillariaceae sp.]
MAANEERVFDDIDNLLEAEGTRMLYKPATDWKNKTKSSSFKKNLRKEPPPIHTSFEEDSPFDEMLPFDESFSGLGAGHNNDPIGKENVEADLFNASMNLPTMTEEAELSTLVDEAATTYTDLAWYRNTAETVSRSPTDLMNDVLVAEGMVANPSVFDCSMERSMERSMEIAAADVYNELSDIVAQTTPTESAQEAQEPTQDQRFVMNILSAPVGSPTSSPTKKIIKQTTQVQSSNIAASPFDEFNPYGSDDSPTKEVIKQKKPVQSRNVRVSPFGEFNPYGSDEMEELDHALNSLSLAKNSKDFLGGEAASSPNKKDHIAIDATPITPPPTDYDMLIDHAYSNHSESDDEEEGIVRIQLTDEELYGSDFQTKTLAEHSAVAHEHDFSLHRSIQVNAVDGFRDEPSGPAPEDETEEDRVMNIISPIRNLLTPKKWKGSPKTPATVGESPTQGDVENGLGDAILRSDLSTRFQWAMNADDDEEYVHWKDRYCTKRQIYLMTIMAVLVISFFAVISVMIGMQNDDDVEQEGINEFYRVTGDGGN